MVLLGKKGLMVLLGNKGLMVLLGWSVWVLVVRRVE